MAFPRNATSTSRSGGVFSAWRSIDVASFEAKHPTHGAGAHRDISDGGELNKSSYLSVFLKLLGCPRAGSAMTGR